MVTLCFLGAVGAAQVTPSGSASSSTTPHDNAKSSTTSHSNKTPTKNVVLKCDGSSGDIHVGSQPATVTFTSPASCPLTSFSFDQPAKGFKPKGPISNGSISFDYDGTPIPSTGYPFKYTTAKKKAMNGNGTGVIKT